MQTFNIFKTLHLKKENRNLLSEVLEYMGRPTRWNIILSFQKEYFLFFIKKPVSKICDNCFIVDSSIDGLGCSCTGYVSRSGELGITYEYYFCKKCREEHNSEYTKIISRSPFFYCLFWISHSCKLKRAGFGSLYEKEIPIHITKDDIEKYRKEQDPIDFINTYLSLTSKTKVNHYLVGKISPPFSEFYKRM